ncbi:hypothetical protein F4809DRAFT_63036 [Biscogniauxia mediterranea]|nr:hypothetical protein F4809DRAFT_63036 [Biscogniauxia mediterranea]
MRRRVTVEYFLLSLLGSRNPFLKILFILFLISLGGWYRNDKKPTENIPLQIFQERNIKVSEEGGKDRLYFVFFLFHSFVISPPLLFQTEIIIILLFSPSSYSSSLLSHVRDFIYS